MVTSDRIHLRPCEVIAYHKMYNQEDTDMKSFAYEIKDVLGIHPRPAGLKAFFEADL